MLLEAAVAELPEINHFDLRPSALRPLHFPLWWLGHLPSAFASQQGDIL